MVRDSRYVTNTAYSGAESPVISRFRCTTQERAAFKNPLNSVFESMSGFTGTGLTMTDNEAVLPATLQ